MTSVAIKGVHIGSNMPCTVRPPTAVPRSHVRKKDVHLLLESAICPLYIKGITILVDVAKKHAMKMPHHGGKPLETHMILSSSKWTSFLRINVVPPVGGRSVQGILLPMCTPLRATLLKGHFP